MDDRPLGPGVREKRPPDFFYKQGQRFKTLADGVDSVTVLPRSHPPLTSPALLYPLSVQRDGPPPLTSPALLYPLSVLRQLTVGWIALADAQHVAGMRGYDGPGWGETWRNGPLVDMHQQRRPVHLGTQNLQACRWGGSERLLRRAGWGGNHAPPHVQREDGAEQEGACKAARSS